MPSKKTIPEGKSYLNMLVLKETQEKLPDLQEKMREQLYKKTGIKARFSVGMVVDQLVREYYEKHSKGEKK